MCADNIPGKGRDRQELRVARTKPYFSIFVLLSSKTLIFISILVLYLSSEEWEHTSPTEVSGGSSCSSPSGAPETADSALLKVPLQDLSPQSLRWTRKLRGSKYDLARIEDLRLHQLHDVSLAQCSSANPLLNHFVAPHHSLGSRPRPQ